MSGTVADGLGSPAVTKGMSALRLLLAQPRKCRGDAGHGLTKT